jgi:hypothetical protein
LKKYFEFLNFKSIVVQCTKYRGTLREFFKILTPRLGLQDKLYNFL